MYNILIADDIYIARVGLKTILEELLGTNNSIDLACSEATTLNLTAQKQYDLIVLDINLTTNKSLSFVASILKSQHKPKVVVMSKGESSIYLEACLSLGALAYITKDFSEQNIKTVFLNALQICNKQIVSETNIHEKNPFYSLSYREQSVATLLLKGYGILEIANELAISSSTASTYKSRIYKKLNISNVLELNNQAGIHGFCKNGIAVN